MLSSRRVLVLLLAVVAVAACPLLVHAGCCTSCSAGNCCSNLQGATCCCSAGGSALCAGPNAPAPECGPVGFTFEASAEEIAAFGVLLSDLQASDDQELRALGKAAADLHDAVVFQDAKRFAEAQREFARAQASLSPEAAGSLQSLQAPQALERAVAP